MSSSITNLRTSHTHSDVNHLIRVDDMLISTHDNGIRIQRPDGSVQILENRIGKHSVPVYCILNFKGELATGDTTGRIRFWDLKTESFTKELYQLKSHIHSLIEYQGFLVSSHADGEIQVWNVETRECVQSWTSHRGWVSLTVYQNLLISAGNDGTIQARNMDGFHITVTASHQPVLCLMVYKDMLISGGEDGQLKFWNRDLNCMRFVDLKSSWIVDLISHNDQIVAALGDGRIGILKEDGSVQMLEGNKYGVLHLLSYGEHLVSGSRDGKIEIWNPETGTCTQCFSMSTKVNSLIAYQKQFVASSDNQISLFGPPCALPEIC
jgi:WD40 repeat protein